MSREPYAPNGFRQQAGPYTHHGGWGGAQQLQREIKRGGSGCSIVGFFSAFAGGRFARWSSIARQPAPQAVLYQHAGLQ